MKQSIKLVSAMVLTLAVIAAITVVAVKYMDIILGQVDNLKDRLVNYRHGGCCCDEEDFIDEEEQETTEA